MSKDIRSYFCSASSSSLASTNRDISESEDSDIEPTVPKKQCHGLTPHQSSSKKRCYLKKWEGEFQWLEYDEDLQGAFCKHCKKWAKANTKTGETWDTRPFSNWKKTVSKMKEHAESEGHIHACQVETTTAARGSDVHQLHQAQESERLKNRPEVKSLLRCTHFLAQHHIAHTTNFSDLVDLVVSC